MRAAQCFHIRMYIISSSNSEPGPSLTACGMGSCLPMQLLLFLLLFPSFGQGVPQCPEACKCTLSVNGTSAICGPLDSFPKNFPMDTISISVEYTALSKLSSDALRGLPNLKELHLAGNRIDSLSPGLLMSTPALEVLDLTGNNLSGLPSGLFRNSETLHSLVLKGNKLDTLQGDWLEGLVALNWLDVSENQLQKLPPDLLLNLTTLQTLDLSDNMLLELPPSLLQGLSLLERLHLEGNHLQTLADGTFSTTPHLSHLFLQGNRLDSLPSSIFSNLTELDMLDLSNNSLAQVPDGLLDRVGLPQHQMKDGFDLSENPWNCDEKLHGLYSWLLNNQHRMFFKDKTLCVGPKDQAGQRLLEVAKKRVSPKQ
ncbi:leucine-rich alpha-2-glycoprotein [Gracilinanus agilis]|uniref:leucine-rich alpha-2-glycoprotein n=1 Tax=Gracilinanus agilis TaxID=191870 RepID=UPI001CFCACC7|nr:leucine-rich alpha-2-glycoprotein [Gracilinanus agilis]